jgi:hypothetical protein
MNTDAIINTHEQALKAIHFQYPRRPPLYFRTDPDQSDIVQAAYCAPDQFPREVDWVKGTQREGDGSPLEKQVAGEEELAVAADAAFPLSLPEGATLGVEYVLHTNRWAKLAGCPPVDTLTTVLSRRA